MNFYAVIILAALLLDFLVSFAADVLNLKRLQTETPKELRGIYEEAGYGKSQEYTRVSTRFGLIISVVDLALLIAFWQLGGFNWLNGIIQALRHSMIVSGLLYIGALVTAKALLRLPFDIYATFVIEERFGFNKTTPRIFILDRLKAAVLGLVISAPLLAMVLFLFDTFGGWAWLYGWLAVTLISFALQYAAPTWLLPLFNKFEPLPDGELKEAVVGFARRVNYPLQGVFVMDGSKRSSKSNAFFTGFGKKKRIALFDTLIEKHTVAEIVAILAHEIGHYKKKHILIGLLVGTLHSGVLFFLLSLFLHHQPLYQAFYMEATPIYAGLLFFGLLYSPVEMLLSLGLHALSRRNEYQADRYAAETTGSPQSMISALKKLTVHNLLNLTPHPFYVFVNHSHPPMVERMRALLEFDKQLMKEQQDE